MIGLTILAGVVLSLFLLSLVRLGGGVKYSQDGLYVRVRFGAFSFLVYPREKKKKEKSPNPQKETPTQEPKLERGGPLDLVKRYLPLICEAAGELKRKIRVDTLYLDLTIATDNAAKTAMAYGYANMAIGMLWPLIEQNFEVRDPRLRTRIEFNTPVPTIYINAALSLRLGQLISFALRFGWKFFKAYQKSKLPTKTQKEAI